MPTKITDHMLKGTSIRTLLQRAAAEAGFNLVDGSFEEGAVVTESNDVVWFRNEGTYYGWDGTIPVGGYIVPAGSTPATAGGVGVGAWSDKTDLMLRGELSDDAEWIATSEGTLRQALDSVGVHVDSVYGVHQGVVTNPSFGIDFPSLADSTTGLQSAFTHSEQFVRAILLSDAYYKVSSNLTLGDPETVDNRSGSNQAPGIHVIKGVSRERSVIKASGDVSGTLLKRHNLAGILLEKFTTDGSGLVDVGLDISWVGGAPSAAPSVGSVFRDICALDCKVAGIVADGMYDCTFDSIKSMGSPIAMSMVGGGGQMNLTNSVMGGILNVGVQNLAIQNTVLLGGLSIQGAADNFVEIVGTQVFPAATNASIPSYTQGTALSCADAGGYGAKVKASSSYFFAEKSCIVGKFGFAGATFEYCVFDWGDSYPFFDGITTGADGRKPHFKFENCDFRSGNSPLGTNPTNYTWEIVNSYVNGVFVERAGNNVAGTWTPVFRGSVYAGTNVYEVNSGKWRREGNLVTAFFDVALLSTSGMGGALLIDGLPFIPTYMAEGGLTISLASWVTFGTGYTQITGSAKAGQTHITIYKAGSGLALSTVASASCVSGTRIAGSITYAVN